jgi:N-acetylglucosaminylphosphatidylinositol deacetylase
MFEQWYALRCQLHTTVTNKCCLIGDADGLGDIRKKELIKSGLQLGIGNKDDILIIEDKYGVRTVFRC